MEKNFLSLIKTRRSVRAYKSEPVPSKALDAVLEAGTYPAQEAGQPAARKQNYIVRTICGEEGKYAKWRLRPLENSSGKCRYRR